MANQVVQRYRERFRATHGYEDPRPDAELTRFIGDSLRAAGNFEVESSNPDFRKEYLDLTQRTRRGLGDEFVENFKGASKSLGGTIVGAGAMVSDVVDDAIPAAQPLTNYLAKKAGGLMESAAENAPTIKRVQDIQDVGDAIRWAVGATGQVAPSLLETAATTTAGAVAGSATAPGPGTVGGAVAGAAGKTAVKGLLKKAVRNLVAKNITKEIGEEAFQAALKTEVKRLAARRFGQVATAANAYVLSAGEIYADLANDPEIDNDSIPYLAAGLGVVAAAPDAALPVYALRKFFPGGKTVTQAAEKQAANYFKRFLKEVAKTVPVEASTEAFQEAVNIAAGKFAKGEDLTLTAGEKDQLIQAAALGAVGGAAFAPVTAVPSTGSGQARETIEEAAPVNLAERFNRQAMAIPREPATPTTPGTQAAAAPASVDPAGDLRTAPKVELRRSEPEPESVGATEPVVGPATAEEILGTNETTTAPLEETALPEQPAAAAEPEAAVAPVEASTNQAETLVTEEEEAQEQEEAQANPLPAYSQARELDGSDLSSEEGYVGNDGRKKQGLKGSSNHTRKLLVWESPEGRIFARGGVVRPKLLKLRGNGYGRGRAVARLGRQNREGNKWVDPEGPHPVLEEDLKEAGWTLRAEVLLGETIHDAKAMAWEFANIEDFWAQLGKPTQAVKARKATRGDAGGDALDALGDGETNPQGTLKVAPGVSLQTENEAKIAELAEDFYFMMGQFGAAKNHPEVLTEIVERDPELQVVVKRAMELSSAQIPTIVDANNTLIDLYENSTASGFAQILRHGGQPERDGGDRGGEAAPEAGGGNVAGGEPGQAGDRLRGANRGRAGADTAARPARAHTDGLGRLIQFPRGFLVGRGGLLPRVHDASQGVASARGVDPALRKAWANFAEKLQGWGYKELRRRIQLAYRDTAAEFKSPMEAAARERFVELVHRYAKVPDEAAALIEDDQLSLESFENGEWTSAEADRLAGPDAQTITQSEAAAFGRIVNNLRAAGLKVDLLEQDVASTRRLLRAENGRANREQRLIRVVMANLLQPNRTNLLTILHEAGHIVFRGLPEGQRWELLSAIRELRTDFDERPLNLDDNPEEQIVERVAQRIAANGLEADEADGLARRLWRLVKMVTVRMLVGLQRAMRGPEAVSPHLAMEYFQDQVESFVRGDATALPGWLLRLGGGPRSLEEQSQAHAWDGRGSGLAVELDPMTGKLTRPRALPTDAGAIAYNLARDLAEADVMQDGPNPELDPLLPRGEPRVVSEVLAEVNQWLGDEDRALAKQLSTHPLLEQTAIERLPDALIEGRSSGGGPITGEAGLARIQITETLMGQPAPQVAKLILWQAAKTLGKLSFNASEYLAKLSPEQQAAWPMPVEGMREARGRLDFFAESEGIDTEGLVDRIVNGHYAGHAMETGLMNSLAGLMGPKFEGDALAEILDPSVAREAAAPQPGVGQAISYKLVDTVALSEVQGALNEGFEAYQKDAANTGKKLDQAGFEVALLGTGKRPVEQLESLGMGTLTRDDLPNSVTEALTTEKAIHLFSKIWGKVRNRKAKIDGIIAKTQQAQERATAALNKTEGQLEDADVQNRELLKTMRTQIRELTQDLMVRDKLSTASGKLTALLQETSSDLFAEGIPAEYARVFKKVYEGKVNLFNYLQEMAKLDVNWGKVSLKDMELQLTQAALENPILKELFLTGNTPLRQALMSLARHNGRQMDMLALRISPERKAVLDELKAIRAASDEKLAQLRKAIPEVGKAKSLRDRLKARYLEHHRKYKKTQAQLEQLRQEKATLEIGERSILKRFKELTAEVKDLKPWEPTDGAEFTVMKQGKKGWERTTEKLRMREGTIEEGLKLKERLAENRAWMREAKAKGEDAGTLYLRVEDQMKKLERLNLEQEAVAVKNFALVRFIRSIGNKFTSTGTQLGRDIGRRFQLFDRYQKAAEAELKTDRLAREWSRAMLDAFEVSGYNSPTRMLEDLYTPAIHLIANEPGMAHDLPGLKRMVFEEIARRAEDPTAVAKPEFQGSFWKLLEKTFESSRAEAQLQEKHRSRTRDDMATVPDENDEASDLYRVVIPRGYGGAVPRRFRHDLVSFITGEMAQRWDNAGEDIWETINTTEQMNELEAVMADLFPPMVIDRWLEPFIYHVGPPVFKGADGQTTDRATLHQAWTEGGRSVPQFIAQLYELTAEETEGQSPEEEAAARMEFTRASLNKMRSLYRMERGIIERNADRDPFSSNQPMAHRMEETRRNNLIPAEHFTYDVYDPVSMHAHVAQNAAAAAFGRNSRGLSEQIAQLKEELTHHVGELERAGGPERSNRKHAISVLGKEAYERAIAAKKYRDLVNDWEAEITAYFRSDHGPYRDLQAGYEAISLITSMVVNNPKTGLFNLLSLTDFPILYRGSLKTSAAAMRTGFGTFAKGVFGSLLRSVGLNVLQRTHQERVLGDMVAHMNERDLDWRTALADPGYRQRYSSGTNAFEVFLNRGIQSSRLLKRAMGRGAWRNVKTAQEGFIPFGPWNWFDFIGSNANIGIALANVRTAEALVGKVVGYLEANPRKFDDPTFEVAAADLGLGDGFFGEGGSFEFFARKLGDYGLGSITDLARRAMQRREEQGTSTSLLSDDEVRALGLMAMNEAARESSVNTRPSRLFSNPALKLMSPLLGWSISKMDQVNEAMRTPEGRMEWATFKKTLATLALVTLPIGLAWSLGMDAYDEWILGKRSNVRELDTVWLVPGVGPSLNLLGVGERSFGQNFMAAMERSARAGNVYGLGQDFLNNIVNQVDPTAGQRGFSLDTRVLVMSTLLNAQTAVRNLIHQRGYSYDMVGRPLLYSLGGNGLLQATEAWNHLTGGTTLTESEQRVTRKINAQNYLRAAGREIGLELRTGGGHSFPTPVSRWVRQMQLAAYGNDAAGFWNAWGEAVRASMVKDNLTKEEAEKKVRSSWKSRHPLAAVFRSKPTETQYRRLLGAMNERGAGDVAEAVRAYERFTEQVDAKVGVRSGGARGRGQERGAITLRDTLSPRTSLYRSRMARPLTPGNGLRAGLY